MKRASIESIELKELGFDYGEGEKVFSQFSYSFTEGEVVYLQGQRGSGKNTFMKLLLGLVSPTEGSYLINGICVRDFSHREFDGFRLNMGHSFDVGGLINNQTLYENFRLLLDYHGYLDPQKRFDYIVGMLSKFGLENSKHLRPAFVSPSSYKAVCVLRAFALKPEIIILDNPTQGMSVEHIPVLVNLINEHRENHSLKHLVISSDDTNLINLLEGKIMRVTTSGLVEESRMRRAG